MERPLPAGVALLLEDLKQTFNAARLSAARQLAQVDESDVRVVQALIDAARTDPALVVRQAAFEALQAPVHQEVLAQHPDLMAQVQALEESFRVESEPQSDAPPAEPAATEAPSPSADMPDITFHVPAVSAPPPVTGWRLALAVVYGLTVSLLLSYAWFWVGLKTNTRYGYGALVFGLAVGWVVSFMSGGNRDRRYSLLSVLLTGVGVAFGEYLIFGRPESEAVYKLDAVDLVIYALALYEGWIIPQRAPMSVRTRQGLIHSGNRKPVLLAGGGILALIVALSVGLGYLPPKLSGSASSHMNRAADLMDRGDWAGARAECEKATNLAPDMAEAYLCLAIAEIEEEQGIAALSDLSKALELGGMPPHTTSLVYERRGLVYLALGAYEKAVADYDEAIALDDTNEMAYVGRGVAYAELGERDLAISDLEKALSFQLSPEDRAFVQERLEALK